MSVQGWWLGSICALSSVLGCGEPPAPVAPTDPIVEPPSDAPVRSFAYQRIDGAMVTAKSYRGRMTLIVMVTTYDTASQAQAQFVEALVHRYVPRMNALLLVLEPPQNAPLVEAYAGGLGLSYDVAMADADTVAGNGPFPGLHHVPSVVLLDRESREVWRHVGIVETAPLEAAIREHDERAR